MIAGNEIYGLMAEFDSDRDILLAARRAQEAGYTRMDACTPHPVEGLADAVGYRKTRVPVIALSGGAIGGAIALLLLYWINVITYPINVGGRPMASWPAFIPPTFELTVLCASLAALFGMLALNRLPQPYHPVFNVPEFERATQDRFFLVIEASDPRFDVEQTRRFLESLNPLGVYDVEP